MNKEILYSSLRHKPIAQGTKFMVGLLMRAFDQYNNFTALIDTEYLNTKAMRVYAQIRWAIVYYTKHYNVEEILNMGIITRVQKSLIWMSEVYGRPEAVSILRDYQHKDQLLAIFRVMKKLSLRMACCANQNKRLFLKKIEQHGNAQGQQKRPCTRHCRRRAAQE